METLIKGGHVIDPASGIDGIMNVVARDHKIVYLGNDEPAAERVVDATGCYVFPGLIDFHTHVDHLGTDEGINSVFFPGNGITATVDSGSTGSMTYEAFYQSIVAHSPIVIKTYLNAYAAGLVSDDIIENYDILHFRKMQEIVDRYRDNILGLKYRYIEGAGSFETFKKCADFAHENGLTICVHTANPAGPLDEMVSVLEKGDIYTHMYQNRGNDNILDETGKGIKQSILDARERGVIFDLANGNANFSFSVAFPAIAAGFWPDVISTDMAKPKFNLHSRIKNLPNVMAKFLQFGMPLYEVIRAVTETPAKLMKMEGKIGTLKVGAQSDIAVFKIVDHPFVVDDIDCVPFRCEKLFLPVMTMVNGDIVFCSGDFAL